MTELVYPSGPAPLARACKSVKASEMLPVVDENGMVLAQAPRDHVHGGSRLLHPVVHLHVINRNADIYLQRRSASKTLLPLYWDTAVGGHVAYGEHIAEALYREAGEELGFYDFNPYPLCTYVFESDTERELVNVFAAVGDFTLHPDKDELDDGGWWTIDRIESSLGKGILTPNFEGEYRKIKNSLLALL